MQTVPRGLSIGLLYRINGTSRTAQLIASHGLNDLPLPSHRSLHDAPEMVVDAALAHQPRFGTDSNDLPASARLWLKAVPAGQFAVLPLAAKGETTLALVLLGADGNPLPFPLRSSLVAAAAVLAAACRESGLTRTVDGDGHFPALSDEPAPASVRSGSPPPASQVSTAPAAGAPRLDRRASVADLARSDTLVSPDTLTDTVASLMEREPNRDAVVLGRHGVPSGIVTRQRLLSQLSQLYGNALYRRKPIQELAYLQPLIVNGTLPPNEAALRATKRPASTRYDPLVVTVGGSYHGLVAVSTLLDHLNGEAVRRARPRQLALRACLAPCCWRRRSPSEWQRSSRCPSSWPTWTTSSPTTITTVWLGGTRCSWRWLALVRKVAWRNR